MSSSPWQCAYISENISEKKGALTHFACIHTTGGAVTELQNLLTKIHLYNQAHVSKRLATITTSQNCTCIFSSDLTENEGLYGCECNPCWNRFEKKFETGCGAASLVSCLGPQWTEFKQDSVLQHMFPFLFLCFLLFPSFLLFSFFFFFAFSLTLTTKLTCYFTVLSNKSG